MLRWSDTMYSFRELVKASKKEVEGKEYRVAVLGNCATQYFSQTIQGCCRLRGINCRIYDTDYNQIDAQLLDPASEVYSFHPETIILWIATEKMYEEFLDLSPEDRVGFADYYMDRLQQYWQLINTHTECKILQPNFTEIDDKALGNYSCRVENSFIYQIRKLNFLLGERMHLGKNVYPVDFLSIQVQYGTEHFFDPALYYNAKMPVALNMLPYLANAVTDCLAALLGKVKKCIVLDLDNTLWGGVIGDDGLGGIEIGELGRGHVFTVFQKWLKQLKDCGILLAVCSKNTEEIAKEPFEKHEEMVLRLSDIAIFVANWEDKATNIRLIQETLNIGMDSMVFVDDNPFERNLVRQMIPEITVPELPEDPAEYLSFLQQCNYFETVSYMGNSKDRTRQYQEEYQRRKSANTFTSIDAYLESLDMFGEAKPFEPEKYTRIAQLSQRSNQFNLRTVRYTEDDIERIADSPEYITLYFTLKDRFGDYGLVSAVILKKETEQEAFIDTWFMSCRVLKRGMEDFIVNSMVRAAGEQGIRILHGEYIPTPKNKMVQDIYTEKGFSKVGENQFRLELEDYKYKKTYIGEEK